MIRKITMIAGALALTIGVLSFSMPAQAQDNEHYACYQLKHKIKVKPKPSGTLNNIVEAAGPFSKCKLKFLCTATEKNASGPPDHQADYCAWQCKGNKPVVAFTITDQFGAGAVSTKKLKFVLNECQVS